MTNRYMTEKWSWVEGSHELRDGILEQLTDAELSFSPGGDNLRFGALLKQMGEIQHSYLQGLKTLTQDWEYRNTDEGLEGSVSRLTAWFHELDAEMKSVTSAFTDDDLTEKKVTRASGYEMPVEMSLEVYIQALLIFLGKAVVYLKAMGKPLPPAVQEWIW
jgi:hypothetical protein